MIEQAPTPVFEEPWHAQVFAITVALYGASIFQWTDWANRFGATLKQHGLNRDLNGGSDYFFAWIETLEDFLADKEIALPSELQALKTAWEQAYLQTPHGESVKIQRP